MCGCHFALQIPSVGDNQVDPDPRHRVNKKHKPSPSSVRAMYGLSKVVGKIMDGPGPSKNDDAMQQMVSKVLDYVSLIPKGVEDILPMGLGKSPKARVMIEDDEDEEDEESVA